MCQLRKKQKKARKKAAKIYERTTKNGTELMVLQVGRSLRKNSLGSKRRVKIEFMLDTRWKFLTEKILLLGINRGERKGASDQFVFNLNQILSKAESKHFYL